MQGTRIDRRRLIILIVSISILVFAVGVDLLTKVLFKNLFLKQGKTVVIENFFYFTFTENSGSAFSFLANKSWSQIFFKILTCVALVGFSLFWVYSFKRNYKTLSFGMSLIIGGAVGNFIDRLAFDKVRDFIGMTFFGWNFPIFNVADICLTVGVVLFMVHFLFLDKEALFKKKQKDDDLSSK